MSPGGLSGLQNQHEGLIASWVGSIPMYSRQIIIIRLAGFMQVFFYLPDIKQRAKEMSNRVYEDWEIDDFLTRYKDMFPYENLDRRTIFN